MNKQQQRSAVRRMDLAIQNWKLEARNWKDDPEMNKQYISDIEELTALQNAIARGNFDGAQRLADAMDTLVRNQIPVQVYYNLFPER